MLNLITYVEVLDRAQMLVEDYEKSNQNGQKTMEFGRISLGIRINIRGREEIVELTRVITIRRLS